MPRVTVKVAALLVAVGCSTAAVEAALRVVDGYRLTTIRLVPRTAAPPARTPMTEWPTAGADAIAGPHVSALPVPDGVDVRWFFTDPSPAPPKPPRPDLDAVSSGYADPNLAKFSRRIWNLNFVLGQAQRRESYWEYLKQIRTPIRVFDPVDHSEYPRYRMIPDDPHAEAWPTGTFESNNIGYRGRDVSVVKPAGTFRIVFVGASTTIDHPSFALSFTDYVGHYLNAWARARGLDVRFEAINAAREGLQSMDLAAVVKQEVVRLAPDVVVYKEGANQFGEAKKLLTVAESQVKPIGPDFLATGVIDGSPANYRSDIVRRAAVAAAGLRPLGEAPRPPYVVHWPAGLDESAPDLSRPDLPLGLSVIVGDLRQIQDTLHGVGADLAVSSFVWMVDDGLRLNPMKPNERAIYWYLNGNEVLWPLSYKDVRRFADFQNRVFQTFSSTNGAYFVDLARWFPRDPALFVDGIHISYPGVKVHGWITFLQLLPLVERRLASHATTRQAADVPSLADTTITVQQIQQRMAEHAVTLPLPALDAWHAATPAVHLTLAGDTLHVAGAGARWAYQILSPEIPVDANTYYRVKVPATVSAGAIGVGVLDQSGHTWISSPLDATPFTFFSGQNTRVQLVVADATPTLGTVKPALFDIARTR